MARDTGCKVTKKSLFTDHQVNNLTLICLAIYVLKNFP